MKTLESRLSLKEFPLSERPYERIELYGAENLSDAELLAVIIKTGTKSESAVDVARKLLMAGGDNGFLPLYDMSLEQLKEISGIGRVKAIQIKALIQICIRMSSFTPNTDISIIKSSVDVSKLLMQQMRCLKKEVFKVVMLNTRNHVIKIVEISVGSLSSSLVHPREVFVDAVKCSCASVILVHNHPSGDPEPSNDDIVTTDRLVKAGEIVGIKVLDHIVIGNGTFISLKMKGLM